MRPSNLSGGPETAAATGRGSAPSPHPGESAGCDVVLTALRKVAAQKEPLNRDEARGVMEQLLSGRATDAQIGALLIALHNRGETVDEIVGFAQAIRAAAVPFPVTMDPSGDGFVDTCGTGGDGHGTFNISTVAAFIVAGAGVRVAKHGNRGLSSRCGSADVMEALGVNVELPVESLTQALREVGIAFLFAPAFHPAARRVQQVRREIRLKSIFNLLGPLTNPARPSGQVVGVYSQQVAPRLSLALMAMGASRALVVHGKDGLDEITITGPTTISEIRGDWLRTYQVSPELFGMERASLSAVSGGDAHENARILHDILNGERSPRRDIVLMNAAAGLVVAGKGESLAEAMPLATDSLDSGRALSKLEALIEFTNRTGILPPSEVRNA